MYRGPDRRRSAQARPRIGGVRQLAWAVLAAAFVFGILRADATGGNAAFTAYRTLRALSAGTLVLAGAELIVTWALCGRASRALDGAGLLLIGGGLLALVAPYGQLFEGAAVNRLIGADARLAISLPGVALLVYASGAGPVDSAIRPFRVLSGITAAAMLLLSAVGISRWLDPHHLTAQGRAELGILAVGWWIAAARRHLIARRYATTWDKGEVGVGVAFALFGLGDAATMLALGQHDLGWAVSAAAIQLVAAVGMLWASTSWLVAELRRDGNRQMRLAGELQARAQALASEQALRERLVHDGRNLLASIRTANVTLGRYADRLDAAAQDKLRDMVRAEVERLGRLLDPAHHRDLGVFDVTATVMPIVKAAAATGVRVRSGLAPGVLAVGRPADTAAVMHALLANAAQHAQGAEVEVWCETTPKDVRLVVADHGPGVPDADLEAVFRRGYGEQAGAAPGGLGLYIGRRLMADQEGALALESRAGWGGYAVMTLAAAPVAADESSAAGAEASVGGSDNP